MNYGRDQKHKEAGPQVEEAEGCAPNLLSPPCPPLLRYLCSATCPHHGAPFLPHPRATVRICKRISDDETKIILENISSMKRSHRSNCCNVYD